MCIRDRVMAIVPLVAPAGTVAVIVVSEPAAKVNAARAVDGGPASAERGLGEVDLRGLEQAAAGLARRRAGSRRGDEGHTAPGPVSYTHLRAHETRHDLVCRLLL